MKRASFLEHVGWTGGGIAFAMTAGGTFAAAAPGADFTFVQISDSHIGSHGRRIPMLRVPSTRPSTESTRCRSNRHSSCTPATSRTSRVPTSFDSAKTILGRLKAPLMVIPGEHDAIGAEGAKRFAAAFPNPQAPDGWWSFDRNGVHFVALVNVFSAPELLGRLGYRRVTFTETHAAIDDRPLQTA